MKKMKLAHFDDPKWSYKDLCRYAKKYRTVLDERIRSERSPIKVHNLAKHVGYLYAYNSQPRKVLIANLRLVQACLYK